MGLVASHDIVRNQVSKTVLGEVVSVGNTAAKPGPEDLEGHMLALTESIQEVLHPVDVNRQCSREFGGAATFLTFTSDSCKNIHLGLFKFTLSIRHGDSGVVFP